MRPVDGDRLKQVIQQWIDTLYGVADIETCEIVLNLIDVLPTLTPPNEWVSVNKRLPEKRKDVLVHYGNGRIGIDWIDSTQCFVFDELYGRVTHWLPIPELPDRRPPEGEEET